MNKYITIYIYFLIVKYKFIIYITLIAFIINLVFFRKIKYITIVFYYYLAWRLWKLNLLYERYTAGTITFSMGYSAMLEGVIFSVWIVAYNQPTLCCYRLVIVDLAEWLNMKVGQSNCPSNRQSDQLRATIFHHPRESSQSDRLRAILPIEQEVLGLKEAVSVLEDRMDRRGSTLPWPGYGRS